MANQKVSSLVTISFIPMTIMCDSGVMLLGEIRCWSLLGFKGLTKEKQTEANKQDLYVYILQHSN